MVQLFPRLSSRGPIEAAASLRHRKGLCRFRDYQVAAPLKRFEFVGVAGVDDCFRDYQVAAPLKLDVDDRRSIGATPVSATIKSRPH